MWAGDSVSRILAACGRIRRVPSASGSSTGVATPGSVAPTPRRAQVGFPTRPRAVPRRRPGWAQSARHRDQPLDITSSIGGLSGTAEGVPMRLQLTVVNASDGHAGRRGRLPWHCTADGRYSRSATRTTFAASGRRRRRTCRSTRSFRLHPGRWPHCHFEVTAGWTPPPAATGNQDGQIAPAGGLRGGVRGRSIRRQPVNSVPLVGERRRSPTAGRTARNPSGSPDSDTRLAAGSGV